MGVVHGPTGRPVIGPKATTIMAPKHVPPAAAVVAATAFSAEAVLFDGTNDYFTKGSDLTGNADGKVGIISFWAKKNTEGTLQYLFTTTSGPGYFQLRFNTLNQIHVTGTDSGATIQLDLKGSAPTDGEWHHYLMSWDLANNYAEIYIDDVATYFTPTKNNATLDYTQSTWYIGSNASTTAKMDGCVAQMYVNLAETLDLTVADNRRLFIDGNGDPVDIGSDGSTPTGTSPIIFLRGRASDFYTNSGTGGGFSHLGNLTTCATSPSDPDIYAVDFDGTTDRLSLTGDLTGNADGYLGTVSFWFKIDGGDGTNRTLLANANSRVLIYMTTANKLAINMTTTAGTLVVNLATVNTILAGSGWHHCMASWDSENGIGRMYIDGTAVDIISGTNATALDYTNTSGWGVMARQTGTQKWNGCIGQMYVNLAEYVDLSVETNRRLFLTKGHGPVNMGTDGSVPTGTAPIIFLLGDATDFPTNQGTGGGFTLTGALADCADSPEPNIILATDFPGADWFSRTSNLTSATDTKVCTVSFWFKLHASGDGTYRGMFEIGNNNSTIYMSSGNQLSIFIRDSAGGTVWQAVMALTILGGSTWHHCMFSIDAANSLEHFYVDGVDRLAGTTLNNANADWTRNPVNLGTFLNGTFGDMEGCLTEFYYNTDEYMDLSVAANREKFYTALGLPADLGADGSNPTGSQPIIYCTGGAEDIPVNYGYGGSILDSVTGTPVDCADSPTV